MICGRAISSVWESIKWMWVQGVHVEGQWTTYPTRKTSAPAAAAMSRLMNTSATAAPMIRSGVRSNALRNAPVSRVWGGGGNEAVARLLAPARRVRGSANQKARVRPPQEHEEVGVTHAVYYATPWQTYADENIRRIQGPNCGENSRRSWPRHARQRLRRQGRSDSDTGTVAGRIADSTRRVRFAVGEEVGGGSE